MCGDHWTASGIDLCLPPCSIQDLCCLLCSCQASWLVNCWEFSSMPPGLLWEQGDYQIFAACGFMNSGPHTGQKCFFPLNYLPQLSVCCLKLSLKSVSVCFCRFLCSFFTLIFSLGQFCFLSTRMKTPAV